MPTMTYRRVLWAMPGLIAVCLCCELAQAQYGGGSGTAADPYQIWTAEQMNAIGAEPNDWDKHFQLMADIDLSAYDGEDGRPAFNIISPDVDGTVWGYQGTPFTGTFDGNHRTIAGLTLRGKSYLAMFGRIDPGGEVKNLALVNIDVAADSDASGLAMYNGGVLTGCSSTGSVGAHGSAAGLVGENSGLLSHCHSTAAVNGVVLNAGGLVRFNWGAMIHCSYTGLVQGNGCAGGLVSWNYGYVRHCFAGGGISGRVCGGLVGDNDGLIIGSYSTMTVHGGNYAGGLAGTNEDCVCHCFSTGLVSGREDESAVGGLIGGNGGSVTCCYSTSVVKGTGKSVGGLIGRYASGVAAHCFWDKQASGQTRSAGGWPLTTAEMHDVRTYTDAGWDWVGRSEDGTSEIWQMPAEGGYPVLAIFQGHAPPELRGQGTCEDPYLIFDSRELGAMIYHDPYAYYRLAASIDLSGIRWTLPVIPWFAGSFEGNDKVVSHLTIRGGGYVGLFGKLGRGANVSRLSILDADVAGSGSYVGVLAGSNMGKVKACSTSGTVTATGCVGGLLGRNSGYVAWSHNAASVEGENSVGGLIGENGNVLRHSRNTGVVASTGGKHIGGLVGFSYGYVTQCCNAGDIDENGRGAYVGGLAGWNGGPIVHCYNTGVVGGHMRMGGLVADNRARISHCYNVGRVEDNGAGLVYDDSGQVFSSFWDVGTTGATWSDGGTGLTTAQMQDVRTYLDTGWDWAGESENGISDVWRMPAGGGYPILAALNGYVPPRLSGSGTPEEPYLVSNAPELAAVVHYDPDANYRLTNSIDLSGMCWASAVIPWFSGTFDGDGFVVSHLMIRGEGCSGLFGQLEYGAAVSDLGILDVNITGSGTSAGGLVGMNIDGDLTCCYSSGLVRGDRYVGGLAGRISSAHVDRCHSTAVVHGTESVGGLIGFNDGGDMNQCYSSGSVEGEYLIGGLVGRIDSGRISQCYSTADVHGRGSVGGLVGLNMSDLVQCYSSGAVQGDGQVGGLAGRSASILADVIDCLWDVETSGQTTSDGGTGKTTVEMHAAATFLDAGWDFAGETANGTEDIWWILEGQDYPRLWWEATDK